MPELTPLDEKLAEVLGLAQAAQDATRKVAKLVGDDEPRQLLERMHAEAKETRERCEAAIDSLEGRKTAIRDKARETKGEAEEMMKTYLSGDDVDGLDGFEFLVMAEAGELGHWEIVRTMATKAKDRNVVKLADWATPIQQGHFETVRSSSLALAQEEDPNEPEG
jgi:hypothetical protein